MLEAWKRRREINRTVKTCRFLTKQGFKLDLSREDIITRRVGTAFVDDILFVFRGISQTDFWKGHLTFSTYADTLTKKAGDNAERIAQKDAKFRIEQDEKMRDHLAEIFRACVLHPELNPEDIADNPSIANELYGLIVAQTFGKKKLK